MAQDGIMQERAAENRPLWVEELHLELEKMAEKLSLEMKGWQGPSLTVTPEEKGYTGPGKATAAIQAAIDAASEAGGGTVLLAAGDYLEITEGRYPLVGLGPRAREAATDEFRLYLKRKPKKTAGQGAGEAGRGGSSSAKAKASAAAMLETPEQQELFERLRRLRKRLADEEGVPPYIVFSDAALRSMCVLMPRTPDEFLEVSGVGSAKLARYGEAFLSEINGVPTA